MRNLDVKVLFDDDQKNLVADDVEVFSDDDVARMLADMRTLGIAQLGSAASNLF